MNSATAESLEVRVDCASQIEERLNAAVQDLQTVAARTGHGILVTRLSPGQYTIALSAQVPFGQTRERTS
jgi:hypothetical protein